MPKNAQTTTQLGLFHMLTCNAQNPSRQASTACELRTYRCTRQTRFRKGIGTRDQIANIHWIIEKARELQNNICFTDSTKPLTVWITTNWKTLKDIGIPHHFTCLLRNLCAGQEATIRNRHEVMDWFKIGKGMSRLYILSTCLFPWYHKESDIAEQLNNNHKDIWIFFL